jgi:hypothetical protein
METSLTRSEVAFPVVGNHEATDRLFMEEGVRNVG